VLALIKTILFLPATLLGPKQRACPLVQLTNLRHAKRSDSKQANESDHDQVDGHDEIQEPGHDQYEDPCQERDQGCQTEVKVHDFSNVILSQELGTCA
jgi:hypothetical protein